MVNQRMEQSHDRFQRSVLTSVLDESLLIFRTQWFMESNLEITWNEK